jgi:hypothetical protein
MKRLSLLTQWERCSPVSLERRRRPMSTKVLGTEEVLAATFQKLDERTVEALALLRLIRPDTSASVAKVLSYALKYDLEIVERMSRPQWNLCEELQAGKITADEFHASYYDDDHYLDALDVVEAMTDEDRAELRARIVART